MSIEMTVKNFYKYKVLLKDIDITDEESAFKKYEKVRAGGRFNMITEYEDAIKAAGLSRLEYFYVINHYSELSEKYKI